MDAINDAKMEGRKVPYELLFIGIKQARRTPIQRQIGYYSNGAPQYANAAQ